MIAIIKGIILAIAGKLTAMGLAILSTLAVITITLFVITLPSVGGGEHEPDYEPPADIAPIPQIIPAPAPQIIPAVEEPEIIPAIEEPEIVPEVEELEIIPGPMEPRIITAAEEPEILPAIEEPENTSILGTWAWTQSHHCDGNYEEITYMFIQPESIVSFGYESGDKNTNLARRNERPWTLKGNQFAVRLSDDIPYFTGTVTNNSMTGYFTDSDTCFTATKISD